MINNASRALIVAAVLVVSATGCGGGDGDSASATDDVASAAKPRSVPIPWGPESLSEAEYIRRANGVCRKSWAEMLDAYAQRYRSARRGKPFAEGTKNIFLPGMQFWFDDISYLGAPPGKKPEIEDMLTALQLAVHSGEEQPVASPQELAEIFAESNRLTRRHGLDSCLVTEDSFASLKE